MKVLILANCAQGLLSFRGELVSRLVSEGHAVVFCVPEAEDDSFVVGLTALEARYVKAGLLKRRSTSPIGDLRLLAFYCELLREERPDVVLTYTIKPNVWGGLACQLEHVPYIANVTGLGTAVQGGGVLAGLTLALYRIGLRGARVTFFQNSANCDYMRDCGVVTGPYKLLPGSGVNTDHFALMDYPGADTPTTFLTVGRIMRDKGTLELIDAACEAKARHPEVRFVLVGSFDEGLENIVRYADSRGIVEYVAPQVDLRPWYSACHALVHPSWHEGMSNVCLEAASTGRPVLASNVPGCKETFDEGVSGMGFQANDSSSLVETLERFISLPWEKRRAMGLVGRAKVEREFDRQIVVDKYLAEIGLAARA